jgi:hypothetical protein
VVGLQPIVVTWVIDLTLAVKMAETGAERRD